MSFWQLGCATFCPLAGSKLPPRQYAPGFPCALAKCLFVSCRVYANSVAHCQRYSWPCQPSAASAFGPPRCDGLRSSSCKRRMSKKAGTWRREGGKSIKLPQDSSNKAVAHAMFTRAPGCCPCRAIRPPLACCR
ncbi:hypothetical protein COCMIDRAFT_36614 [Bipolaris oryzae ATCC 44560]|uniref:Uncharacterized protein n=1 Tax=Bipolaris oryzae ATCC 44560 TaxID=930090 RepID=W6Z6W5_COCMI|nr:uncharacterized protein COCMIDRAFT_36614 [Bipolaris oryzae ATCC 44560]EUC45720.1 hypothetical protein COCMIDRAFT_36614 [Bipolaris oryzae ATCC 44560]